ncbi:type II secretion system protein [bacterium]|nr:MAG: type II secretion system protein [bacterium]
MTDKKMKKGFTLIEIVIVLAIAALIMVVVFFAVQGAQREQRNTTRKDVANRVKAAMVTARGNNNGGTVTDAVLATYVPAAERAMGATTIGVATGVVFAAGCTVNNTVNVQWATPDTASICLETGGATGVPYLAR